MRPAVALPALVALALITAGVLSGCGGASARSTQSAQALLRETFAYGQPIDSGRMKLVAALSGTGATDRRTGPRTLFSVLVQGPFQSLGPARLPRFALLVDVSAAPVAHSLGGRASTAAFGAIHTGGRLFLELDGARFLAPASAERALESGYRQAARQGAGSAPSGSLAGFGVDPGRWLTSPTLEGAASIAGEPTLHVIAGLDVQRFLADTQTLLANGAALGLGAGSAAPSFTPARLSALSHSLRSARVDVFTGARDHRLRRLSVGASVLAGARASVALGGLRTARLTFVLEFADLDRRQRIAAPRDPLPLPASATVAHSSSSSRSTPSSSSSSSSSASSRSPSGSSSPPAP